MLQVLKTDKTSRYKSTKLIGLHPLCAVMFAIGYSLREYGTFNYMYSIPNLIVYILSQVFIYICPPLLELANYKILGRLFYYIPYYAPVPPGKVMRIFGGLMILVETLNSLGISLASNPSSSQTQQHLGNHLILAALSIQLIVIIIFLLLAAIFHTHCTKSKPHFKAISTTICTLYISMALIFIRCIYRLVEHLGDTTVDIHNSTSLGNLSPILRYEWFFYVFEAMLMLMNSVVWNIWHPGRYLPRSYHVYLAKDGVTEVEMGEEVDGRSGLEKVGAVLTLGVLFGKKEGSQMVEAELGDYGVCGRGS
ncbi:RTA1 domain-containing protein [Rutstroemia sp. NJR-2017a WRK4]|nr:RTA1 domain-containing protein [Rutstroemia sp. NJR-2017a WRK4]